MTPAQVRAQIATGDTAPVYLVESDDLPSRQEVAQAFLALVDEGLHAFNVATFFARDATTGGDRDALYAAILSTARTLPMMAPRRLVVVHDADALLTPKRVKDDDGAEAGPKRRARIVDARPRSSRPICSDPSRPRRWSSRPPGSTGDGAWPSCSWRTPRSSTAAS